MDDLKKREGTIKYIIPNLRHRWKDELASYDDNQIAVVWEQFELSDDFGDNDAKFPEWFEMMAHIPKAPTK